MASEPEENEEEMKGRFERLRHDAEEFIGDAIGTRAFVVGKVGKDGREGGRARNEGQHGGRGCRVRRVGGEEVEGVRGSG